MADHTEQRDVSPDAGVVVFESASEEDTRRLAGALAGILEPGDVVALVGDLGAGKTILTRMLCEALEVPRDAGVSSPTFALVNLYDGGRLPVAHLDLYRLDDEDELEALGFRDLLAGDRVVVVEWPERVGAVLEVATLRVDIEDLGPTRRRFVLRAPSAEEGRRLRRALSPGR
ncbi:MAG: tRNA (adenosine(37)-N6)-threonylcarbamoyltransferase complex ATPase subunit type 1 TsaE [Myxococcota bacterium]